HPSLRYLLVSTPAPPISTLFPYTTLFRSIPDDPDFDPVTRRFGRTRSITVEVYDRGNPGGSPPEDNAFTDFIKEGMLRDHNVRVDRKSTRLNSSHVKISYAVFCLKKKNEI